jgi:uncharacterized protein YgbK (DUF1537 family)
MIVAVIADDITGAAEMAGIGFRHGFKTSLMTMTGQEETLALPDCELLVCATDTRSQTEQEAARITRQVTTRLVEAGVRYFFKKVDSALRGHVEAELQAMLEVLPYESALYLPANPSKGRIIEHGQYTLNGRPLHETDFAVDPEFPATTSTLTERFPSLQPWDPEVAMSAHGLYTADMVSNFQLQFLLKQVHIGQTLLAGAADLFEARLRQFAFEKCSMNPVEENPEDAEERAEREAKERAEAEAKERAEAEAKACANGESEARSESESKAREAKKSANGESAVIVKTEGPASAKTDAKAKGEGSVGVQASAAAQGNEAQATATAQGTEAQATAAESSAFSGFTTDSILVVCGSTQSQSLEETPYIRQHRIPLVQMPKEVFEGSEDASHWLRTLRPQWQQRPSMVLTIGYPSQGGKAFAERLRAVQAQVVKELLATQLPRELVIEGGATAFAILRQLGWTSYLLTDEIAPGVVRMHSSDASCFVTLKPGSYDWGETFHLAQIA